MTRSGFATLALQSLALFIAPGSFLLIGLQPIRTKSVAADQPAGAGVSIAATTGQAKTFTAQEMRGQSLALECLATGAWPCRDEHPLLIEYAKVGGVPIYGLNYKTTGPQLLQLLKEEGNPRF